MFFQCSEFQQDLSMVTKVHFMKHDKNVLKLSRQVSHFKGLYPIRLVNCKYSFYMIHNVKAETVLFSMVLITQY